MKAVLWILSAPLIVFAAVFLVLFVHTLVAGPSEAHTKQRARSQACEQMLADAAPGPERRMTREVCARMGVR